MSVVATVIYGRTPGVHLVLRLRTRISPLSLRPVSATFTEIGSHVGADVLEVLIGSYTTKVVSVNQSARVPLLVADVTWGHGHLSCGDAWLLYCLGKASCVCPKSP